MNSKKQVEMAKTSYRNSWWLIQAMEGEFGRGSYLDGKGYSMNELHIFKTHRKLDVLGEDVKEKFRQDLMRWRGNVYNDFGLAILSDSTPGVNKGKGNGGYYYFLMNPEILDEDGKSLREFIKYLAENEGLSDERISLSKMSERYAKTSSLGFVSTGTPTYGYLSDSNTHKRETLGHDNLVLVQFAMKFGEVLTIKYGKVKAGIDINAPYSFEPYQVKEIEGRWFAIGNLYPLGHKEASELAIYDLARMKLAYDDNPDFKFEPVEDFDIYKHINQELKVANGFHPVNQRPLVTIAAKIGPSLKSHDLEMHPLCSAQTRILHRKFTMYINFSHDLIVQLGSYGDELSFDVTTVGYEDPDELRTITQALNIFRKTPRD